MNLQRKFTTKSESSSAIKLLSWFHEVKEAGNFPPKLFKIPGPESEQSGIIFDPSTLPLHLEIFPQKLFKILGPESN